MEIERKFLVKELPENLENYDCKFLEQAYISIAPVIRIRTVSNKKTGVKRYILTVKSIGTKSKEDGMLAHEEFEIDIEKEAYDNLMKKTEGIVISKYRYIIPLADNLKVELDVFKGDLEGLIMAEIEFPTEDMAKKYDPPAFLSKEVTYDTRFHNNSMTRMSKSQISDLILFAHENC